MKISYLGIVGAFVAATLFAHQSGISQGQQKVIGQANDCLASLNEYFDSIAKEPVPPINPDSEIVWERLTNHEIDRFNADSMCYRFYVEDLLRSPE